MLLKDKVAIDGSPKTFIVSATPDAQDQAFRLLAALRASGISADSSNLTLSIKSQMRSADKSGAAFALIIGEDEVKAGTVTVKPLKEKGEQLTVPAAEVPAKISDLLGGRVIKD